MNDLKNEINDLENIYKQMFEYIENINAQIILEFKQRKIGIVSRENYSIQVSYNVMEDIKTIFCLKKEKFENRYVDMIIRNMCEQIIEYIFNMNNFKCLKNYFGVDLALEDDMKSESNSFEVLKNMGQKRFEKNKRKSVKYMAKSIGENEELEDRLSLYQIYSLESEEVHNSYFGSFIDLVDIVEEEHDENQYLQDKLHYIMICIIVMLFVETYLKFNVKDKKKQKKYFNWIEKKLHSYIFTKI